jgi:hypothetical protein
LLNEVRDLLDAGRVGLYEIDLLAGSDFNLSGSEAQVVARDGVLSLVDSKTATLTMFVWPLRVLEANVDTSIVWTDGVWRLHADGTYVALDP